MIYGDGAQPQIKLCLEKIQKIFKKILDFV